MEVIRNKRILGAIGIICLILGMFLPYITISFWGYSQSISLWGYWEGKIMLVLTIANMLFIFKDYIEKYIPQLCETKLGQMISKFDNPKFSLIPTIIIILFGIYLYTTLEFDSSLTKPGVGFYVSLAGAIILVLHAFLYKGNKVQDVNQVNQQMPNQNIINNQQEFNNLNQTMYSQNNINQSEPVNILNNQPNAVQVGNVNQPMDQNVNINTIGTPMQNTQINSVKYCTQCGKECNSLADRCDGCGNLFN